MLCNNTMPSHFRNSDPINEHYKTSIYVIPFSCFHNCQLDFDFYFITSEHKRKIAKTILKYILFIWNTCGYNIHKDTKTHKLDKLTVNPKEHKTRLEPNQYDLQFSMDILSFFFEYIAIYVHIYDATANANAIQKMASDHVFLSFFSSSLIGHYHQLKMGASYFNLILVWPI